MAGFAVSQSSPLNTAPEQQVGAAQPQPFFDSVAAAADQTWNVDRAGVRGETVRAELWRRHQAIEAATGQKLTPSDTMSDGPNGEALSYGPLVGDIARGVRIGAELLGIGHSDDAYEAAVERLRAERPAAMANVETRRQLDERVQAGWSAKAAKASQAYEDHPVGAFLGSAGASLADPPNLAAAVLTGPLGAGRPLAARMLLQAGANAGIETLQTPEKMIQADRYGGPAYTPGQAALDVAAAGAGGAGFEVLATGAHAAGSALVRRLARSGPDILRSVAPGGAPPDPAVSRAAQVVEQAQRDDAAIGAQSGADHSAALDSLDAHQLPPLEPTRDLPEIVPDSGDGSLRAADYRGRTIWGGTFDPKAVAADPVRFQYKSDGDAEGVTARLKGVEAWDATASGKVIVWEDAGGNQFIADGHQRRALALRMEDKGWDARLDGYLFREADGWSAQDVRTVAALKNIREGAGSPLDAAKVLRESPAAINDRSLPVSGDFMSQARGLALLSDPAFRAVVNHVIPERYGAEVGLLAATRPDLHENIVGLLHAAEPANGDEARALVVEALQDDWIKHEGDQADLFGYDPSQSAMIARAKIKGSVIRSLGRDARLYSTLVRNADAIEAGGNALARDANEAKLAIDRTAQEVVSKLALRAGPVGEAMQAAVARVHAGETPATAAKDVLARVREALAAGERLDQERGVILDPPPPSEHQLKLLEPFDDPAGKGALAQTREAPEDAAPGGTSPAGAAGDVAPGELWKASPEQLRRMLDEKALSDDEKLRLALGSDDAVKEFKRLDRAQNNVMDPQRADAAAAEFDAKFGNLTPDQERLIYGIGETDAQVADIKTVLAAHSDVIGQDPDEWLGYMAAVSARDLTAEDLAKVQTGEGSAAAQAAFVRMQLVYEHVAARGIDPNSIPERMVTALVEHARWTPAQAQEVIASFLADLKAAHTDQPSAPGLFDDLMIEDRHQRAIEHLRDCSPGGE